MNELLEERILPAAKEVRLPDALETWYIDRADRAFRGLTSRVLKYSVARLATVWITRRTLLTERATQDEDPDARRAALEALARGWPERDDTRTVLTERAARDEDPLARIAALEALARGWPERAQALFTERAAQAENKYARRAALEALARLLLDRRAVVLLSRDLDGAKPFLDPLEPVPEDHLRKGAERLGISEQQARELLAACETDLGWNPLTGYQPG